MKLLPLVGIASAVGYVQDSNVVMDRVEIIYLPNNTCHISVPVDHVKLNQHHRDYVRACLNNRHLRIKIQDITPATTPNP